MRVLQLTNYPTVNPMHGGQIRCHHIVEILKKNGHEVNSVAIYGEQDYQEAGPLDFTYDLNSSIFNKEYPWLYDYYSGVYLYKNVTAYKKLQKIINGYNPDVILVEQPWLFKAALKAKKGKCKLIYSSQNVEWRLKERMFQREHAKHQKYSDLLKDIKAVEMEAVQKADYIVACTNADAEYYKLAVNDARKGNVIVAGNGVEPFTCNNERVEEWRKFLERKTAVFVSSAHIPNAQGFWDMMAPGLTFLKPNEKILVLGGVASILMSMQGFNEFSDLNKNRLNMAGFREKTELQALIRASHVIMLPITEGEGSNLKTAEALESGCYIVATSKAFRGYENALLLPHVFIHDNAEDFRKRVRLLLDFSAPSPGTPIEIKSKYYWNSQLKGMVDLMDTIKENK